MRFRSAAIILTAALSLLVCGMTELDKPMYVEVFVRGTTPAAQNEKVSGDLLRYDDAALVVKSKGAERELKWAELSPSSAYVVKMRLIDKTKASDWLELGRFAWSMNIKDQARSALASAVKIDPSLKDEAASILASTAGAGLPKQDKPPTTIPAAAAGSTDSGGLSAASSSDVRPAKNEILKYQKSTPEQDERAIAAARKRADEVAKTIGVNFKELQTDHFILFTDWDPREYGWLRQNLEGAYAVVSQQFEIPVKENVFVGKLPVYMFNGHDDFTKFAKAIDGFDAPQTVAGYYHGRNNGSGHMAMWKPDVQQSGGNIHQAELRWAYVLTHEFTHAFVARYRSNEQVPRWLNEGLAEVISNRKFPRENARVMVRTMATRASAEALMDLFDSDKMPGGEMYPVMMTMVETLLARDPKAFLAYFDDLKAGSDPDEALKKHYGVDNAGLLAAWKSYVMSNR